MVYEGTTGESTVSYLLLVEGRGRHVDMDDVVRQY